VLAHAPGVQEVAVFGLADDRWGQKVCAAVTGSTTEAAVIDFAKSQMAAHKCPKAIFIVDELPRTSTGKIQRRELASQLGFE